MGQVLHGRATTTKRIRKEIQASSESIMMLAIRYHLNPKTVAKWKKRNTTSDAKMGAPSASTVLTELEEKAICVFRKSTELALDDCYIALKDSIPHLTRSSLHRCLQRHALSRLPKKGEKALKAKKAFKEYILGYVHIDITEIRLEAQKLYLFIAIDRITKYVYVELHMNMKQETSVDFLTHVFQAFPYKIHTVLTDNGSQFTYRLLNKKLRPKKIHPFDRVCKNEGARHRLTKFRHPWTNGQVERFNGTIKTATVKKYHYSSVEHLKRHLHEFVMAYNHGKKLKSLKFLTPYEKIIKEWHSRPKDFKKNPYHFIVGLNS